MFILAWRNMWRNKLRSVVIITAVTLGIFSGIFFIAFSYGMMNDRVQIIIGTEVSHIQIHQPGFKDNNQLTDCMADANHIVKKAESAPHVIAASKRLIINAMMASAETGTGVVVTGVDPDAEKRVTLLSTKIIEGKYLDSTGRNSIVISERLAQKLNVGLKNKLIITLQDIHQNITGGAFRVVGIYRTDNMMFDEANAYVRNPDLEAFTGLNNMQAHEIAILLTDNEQTDGVARELSGYFPNLDVQTWLQLSPEAGYLVSAMGQYMLIFIVVILLALCFGIINTMLMVIMERMRELGMLMAIGMSRKRVFVMIMLETIFLSLTGGTLGLLIGYATTQYLGRVGLDLYFWKEAFAEMGYASLIYPAIDHQTMWLTAIMIVVAGMASSLYPAYRALKINPSDAIRTQ